MAWIKRNLWFVVGGATALLLLGAAIFYVFQSMGKNSAALDKLHEIYGNLDTLTKQKPAPGNEKVNNTQAAKEQEAQLRAWILQTGNYFTPIDPIPTNNPVTSELFASALRKAIDQLQHEAEAANVMLPPKYGFSFEAERSLVKFVPGGLPDLTMELGEVKTISEILFAARVNGLDSIQRVRVSEDDVAGAQGDYFEGQSVTNESSVITPYIVTFRSFGGEVSQVLARFASSPHGFIIKAINVRPAGSAPLGVAPAGNTGEGMQPSSQPMPGPLPGRNGLQTVLKEQLLRVTLEVDIIKLLPKS